MNRSRREPGEGGAFKELPSRYTHRSIFLLTRPLGNLLLSRAAETSRPRTSTESAGTAAARKHLRVFSLLVSRQNQEESSLRFRLIGRELSGQIPDLRRLCCNRRRIVLRDRGL
jgi:hypothetical protein